MSERRQSVLIFRSKLLPYSEIWIREQCDAMKRFLPYYMGLTYERQLELPPGRSRLVNIGMFMGERWPISFRQQPPWRSLIASINPPPALVHAHFGPDATLAMPIAEALKLPLVATFHGYDVTKSDEYFYNGTGPERSYLFWRSQLFRTCSLATADSDYLRRCVIARGMPPERVVTHYIGVDVKLFSPDPHVAREPIVLFAGRLVEKKGCDDLIRAMEAVQAAQPAVKLIILGHGPLKAELESLARQLKVQAHFVGAQPSLEVRRWMNRSKVFCVPSVTAANGDTEGFGIVFIEAQAMGLPVVSTCSGGIPEAVLHGSGGLLVPERDPKALAQAILTIINDTHLWQKFSREGRARVCDMFDIHKQTSLLEDLYGKVLRERS